MTKLNSILAGSLAIAALAACAPVEDGASAEVASARQCFFVSSINGFGEAPDGPNGDDRLYVFTGANDNWLFEVTGSCLDLDFTHQIAFDPRTRTSICTGDTETLLVPSTTGVQRCSVRLLARLTDEERRAADHPPQ